jgi:hypothetical protein
VRNIDLLEEFAITKVRKSDRADTAKICVRGFHVW